MDVEEVSSGRKRKADFSPWSLRGFAHIFYVLGLVIFSVRLHFRRHWGWLCDDLFVWKREVIGFSSFICRAPSQKNIFRNIFTSPHIFFPSYNIFAHFGGRLPVCILLVFKVRQEIFKQQEASGFSITRSRSKVSSD